MDSAALERILAENSSHTSAVAGTHVPIIVIPDDCSIKSLEEFGPEPIRQRVRMNFRRFDEFASYVSDEADSSTVVLIDPDGSGAKAIINFGTHDEPGWQDHTAWLSIPNTDEYNAINSLCCGYNSQKDLADFLEDWRDILTIVDGDGEEYPFAAAVSAVRSVTIEQVRNVKTEERDFEMERSELEKLSANSNGKRLPGILRATLSIREGLDPVQIEIKLSINTSSSKPQFGARFIRRESILNTATKEVDKKIRAALQDSVKRVYIGNI